MLKRFSTSWPATFILHLSALSLAAWFAFSRNIDRLFYHYDGTYMFIDALAQRGARHGFLDLWSSFKQALGTVQFQVNLELFPFYWPILYIADFETAKICVYLLMTAALFSATYATARMFFISNGPALLASWTICLLGLPIIPRGFFYEIMSIAPYFILIAIMGPIVLAALLLIEARKVLASLCGCILLFLIAIYLLAVSPTLTVVIVPGMIPFVAAGIGMATGRRTMILRLTALIAVAAIGIALRWPWFLYGLFAFTSANFYTSDFLSAYSGEPQYVSQLFQAEGLEWPWLGPKLVIMAMVGAVIACRDENARLRAGAYTLFGVLAVVLVARLAFAIVPVWALPPPIYPEIAIWPLYASYAAFAVFRLVAFVTKSIVRLGGLDVALPAHAWAVVPSSLVSVSTTARRTFEVGRGYAARALGRRFSATRNIWPIVAGFTAIVAFAYSRPPTISPYQLPPAKAPIVDTLSQQLAIKEGGRFEGRVATILPIDITVRYDAWNEGWMQQMAQMGNLIKAFGNDHLSHGLWWYDIPTIFAYNQYSSPALHMLRKLTLMPGPYPQHRNVSVYARSNPRILGLLGVRYVISPESIASVGSVRQTVDVGGLKLRLSEIEPANLGTYSPTIVERQSNIHAAISRVAADDFNPQSMVVVGDDFLGPLVSTIQSAMYFSGGDLRIMATSTGRSLIVVPREYSRCLELAAEPSSNATLHRVDGFLTGILFEKQLDATLAFRFGPFRSPTCRFEDYQDFEKSRRTSGGLKS